MRMRDSSSSSSSSSLLPTAPSRAMFVLFVLSIFHQMHLGSSFFIPSPPPNIPAASNAQRRILVDTSTSRSIRLPTSTSIRRRTTQQQHYHLGRRLLVSSNKLPEDNDHNQNTILQHSWSPQDLTQDNPGYLPIPDNDYIKQYQASSSSSSSSSPKKNPAVHSLWPVEFFVVAYRRVKKEPDDNKNIGTQSKSETQILVRPSANGTSKWGLGTGVPVTRWCLASSSSDDAPPPPPGYQWSIPPQTISASIFPEYNPSSLLSSLSKAESSSASSSPSPWSYRKIDISQDAFHEMGLDNEPNHRLLEDYALRIRDELIKKLEQQLQQQEQQLVVDNGDREESCTTTAAHPSSSWQSTRLSVVKSVVDKANSIAAIQGTLRMSGLLASDMKNRVLLPDPATLVESMRIYTMFPQMPNPLPLPSTPSEELQKELAMRNDRMAQTGRDPHKDRHGRIYTHKSTSNVSNTIHGVYFTIDLTKQDNVLPEVDDDEVVPPAFDLFGTQEIQREWKSLEELKVLDDCCATTASTLSNEDPKPTFISGFIVRQLVKEGVIRIDVDDARGTKVQGRRY